MTGLIHCGPVQSVVLYTARSSTTAVSGGHIKEGQGIREPYYTCETQA